MDKPKLSAYRRAVMLGFKTYDPCHPCPKGHVGLYYTSSQSCIECATENSQKVLAAKRTVTTPQQRTEEDVRLDDLAVQFYRALAIVR